MAFNYIVGGRGSNQAGSYQPIQIQLPPYPVGLPPYYEIYSPGVAGVGEAPSTDATNRILDASTATLPTGWSLTRSTTATYTNSSNIVSTAAANALRTDYTSAGALRGYLLESSAVQLTASVGGAITTTVTGDWFRDAAVTETAINVADPAGGTAGSTINFTTTGGSIHQSHVAVTIGAIYTISLWIKQSATSPSSFVRIATNNTSAWGTGMGAKFAVPSTWTRISVTGVAATSVGSNGNVADVGIDNRDYTTGTADSSVVGNVDVWGFQIELGSVATSFIPCTSGATTTTRAADAASFTLAAATTDLALTYDDGTVVRYTGVPGGSTFNVPTSNSRLLYIDDNSVVVSANAIINQTLGGLTTTAVAAAAVQAVVDQSLGALSQSLAVTSGSTSAAWNPSDKDASITLTNSNLTGSISTTPSANVVVRADTAWTTAGQSFTVTFSALTITSGAAGVAISNLSQSLSAYPGDPNSVGYFADGYVEWPGGSASLPTFGVGDVVKFIVNAASVTIQVNGGTVGTVNTLPSGSLYPAMSLRRSGDTGTADFSNWAAAAAASTRSAVASQTLGALTQAAPITVSAAAVAAQTLGSLNQSLATTVVDAATAAQTLGALTQAATSTVKAAAAVAQTLGALGQTTIGTVGDAAAVAQSLGALGQTATDAVGVITTAAQTLGSLGQTAPATIGDVAITAQTLGALGQSVSAAALDVLTTSQTLGSLGQTVAATHATGSAAVAQTLDVLGQALTSVVAVAATTSQTLGALSQTTTAAATDTATTSQTLGALTQASTAIHTASNAVVGQTLGALGQTAAVAAQDAVTVAQTLGALQQAVATAAASAAATAQTLGALQQLSSMALAGGLTTTETLGALQQTAAGAVQVNALVSQLMGALGQATTSTIVGNAVVNQTLDALGQAVNVEGPGFHVTTAQTLGDLSQTALATVGDAAAIAQNLGAISQQTAATVDVLATVTQALGELAQTATAAPPAGADFILAEQTVGALQQLAAGKVTIATAVSQVLSALAQRSPTGVLDRATVSQVLRGLQQAASVELPVPTTILPETVISVMYEHRILVVPSEARTLVVPGMYAGVLAGGLGELTGPVVRLSGEHLLQPLRQAAEAITRPIVALPDNIITLEEDTLSALLWEDGTFFTMEDVTTDILSIDNAVELEDGTFLLTEAGDTFGLEDQTIQVIATLPDDFGLMLEEGTALLAEDGTFLGQEIVVVVPTADVLVLEEGEFLLLEDGDFFGLESGAPIGVAPTAAAAQQLGKIVQAAAARVSTPPVATTWSPVDRDSTIVLTNNNLTATYVPSGVTPGG